VDPWYGYICYTDYPTKSTDALSYQATLGLRYEFPNDMTFMRFGYTSQWLDLDNSNGTPRFDVIVSRSLDVLARIFHQLSTAAGDAPHSAVLSRLGVLDVLSSTPPRPSVENPTAHGTSPPSRRNPVRNPG